MTQTTGTIDTPPRGEPASAGGRLRLPPLPIPNTAAARVGWERAVKRLIQSSPGDAQHNPAEGRNEE